MNERTPLVSIIIPTYNRAYLIGETLDSVLAQTYQNWECIVVDDGSSDNTDELMAKYMKKDSRFQYHHRPKGRLSGGNAARNYGFEMSSGEFIQWFDSDDLMHPKKLERNLEQFIEEPSIVVSISSVGYLLKDGIKERLLNLSTANLYEDYVLKKIAVSCQVPLWSKTFLNERELFNPSTLRGQEYELYSELFYDIQKKFGLIKEPLVFIRKDENSITDQYKHGDDKYIKSYNSVLQGILINIIFRNEKHLYNGFLQIYYKNIIHCLVLKKYSIALENVCFLFNNTLENKTKEKLRFLKDYILIILIMVSNGSLYFRLKPYILKKYHADN